MILQATASLPRSERSFTARSGPVAAFSINRQRCLQEVRVDAPARRKTSGAWGAGRTGAVVKRNYYIDERCTKALALLSALTGRELSKLLNEALSDLIEKYQPSAETDLMNIMTVSRKMRD